MAQTDASIFPIEFSKKKKRIHRKLNPYFTLVIKKLSRKLLIPVWASENPNPTLIFKIFDEIEESVRGHFCAV